MRTNYTKLMLIIAVLLFCPLLCSLVEATGLADTAWPKFQGNLQNTGQSQYLGPQTSRVIWNFSAEHYIGCYGGPTIGSNGTIYVGSRDCKLYALNQDGTLKWSYDTGGKIYSSPTITSDGTIYIGNYNGKFYALNSNGTQKWNYTAGDAIYSSPAIGSDGTIYFGSYDSKFYALNPNGTQKWNYTTNYNIRGSPAIGSDGTIYVGSQDHTIYAFNPNGTLKWSYYVNGMLDNAPAVDSNGIIYIGCEDSKLYAFYPNGTLKWSYETGYMIRCDPAIASDGTIYIGSEDNNLYALNSDGALKWKYTLSDDIYGGSPAIGADGTVYIGSEDNYIYALSSDGTLKWCYSTGNDITGAAAIGEDNTLYIGSRDYKLYAFQDEAITPVANFTASPTSGDSPLTASFTDLSENYPTSWSWDFGDGDNTNSTKQNPVHTYTSAGTYNVTLNVTNRAGSAEKSKIDYITAKNTVIPIANFSAEPTTGNGPLTVQFTDESSNNPTSWFWDFGDGSSSTDQNPVHTFEATGTYTVNLTAINIAGNTTESKENCILVTGIAPVANFSAEPASGDVPLTVQFTDNSTGYPTSWFWDFGDGDNTNATKQNPVHTYIASGTYNVTLTATNEYGNDKDSKIDYITVESLVPGEDAPVASFTTDSDSGSLPFTVHFTDTTTGNVTGWFWDFGDGETSEEQNPVHAYIDTGTRTVTLLATGPGGTTKATAKIKVTAPLTTYEGGSPLLTVQEGNVSGGLWHNSWPGFSKSCEKTFTLPDYTEIKWARLYADVYCGLMDGNKSLSMTIDIDGDGDGIYELQKHDAGSIIYSGTPAWLNDHVVRVTSDYLMWYDLTDNITGNEVNIKAASSGNDGRIKHVTLVVAYDDGDDDEIYYCVNQGHDIANTGSYTGSTVFGTSALSDHGIVNLTSIYCASSDGAYTFNGKSLTSGASQGEYFGWRDWNVTEYFNAGQDSTLTYTLPGSEGYYKIQLTLLEVSDAVFSGENAPIANFTATPTSGEAPLTVQFTDLSTNATSWRWDFGDDATSNESNPSHTYTTVGTYDVTLTATNADGINVEKKIDYITVTSGGSTTGVDLSIEGTINPVPSSAVFAREANKVEISDITNIGSDTTTNITVSLYANDTNDTVPVATTNISSLAAGESTTVTVIDPTIRDLEGGTVTYTASLDPENLIEETNETNNNKSSVVKSVKYNGYKGKGIYWENGSNITTKQIYDLRGNLIYSTQSKSAYKSIGWTTRTETWNSNDLPIPKEASIEKALLYISYNWDTTSGGVPDFVATFNGKTLELGTPYTDKSNFGTYADYKYGLYPAINVTELFNRSGDNTLVMTPNSGNSNSLYPSTLAVLYKDSNATRKLIFINEECDELGYSESSYGTTMDEATAYVPFTGLTLDPAKVQNATLHSFAGSAGPDEGNLFFNGVSVATKSWAGTSKTASAEVFDVKKFLTATDNEAAVQGTESGGMAALHQFLVVEYIETAPVADFSADLKSGDAPLTVKFTDSSTGTPTSWTWDFNNDGVTDSENQSPTFTYKTPGTYSVKLTVTSPGGTDEELKSSYITVKEPAQKQPDLIVSSILPSSNVTANVSATIMATLNNTGTADAGAFNASLFVNDTLVGTESVSGLVAGGTTELNFSWTPKLGGNYSLKVKADSEADVVESDETNNELTILVTVSEAEVPTEPIADFTANVTLGKVPLSVKFTDCSTGSVTSWLWDFGDGTNASEQNPSHTYSAVGNYSVKLTVTNTIGTDSELKTDYMTVSKESVPVAPVANFTADVTSGKAPLTIKFTDTSTGVPTSWAWDFDNDGITDSYKQNPSFTYETPGSYTVNLTVANEKGTDTETKVDYITVKPVLPTADFSADRYSGTCPLIVQFTDLSQDAEEWSWDFDNNAVIDSSEQNPKFTYTEAGNYIVNLTVSNNYGTDSYIAEIVVKEFKSEEENYSVSLEEEIEDINDTTKEIVINSSSSNVEVDNDTIKIDKGKLNISIHTDGVKEEGGQLKGNYTNATVETESETSDLGGNLSSVNTSLNATLSENLSALLKGNASITTTVVPGAPDNETESAFQLAGADFAEDMEIAYSLVINKSGLDGVTIKDAYISMTVPKTYVDSHGGTEAFVVMSLHEGKVTVLESSITQNGDYYIFTAYSPDGFSVKALVSYTPKTEAESSYKSGGGGGSSEKLKIFSKETQEISDAESGSETLAKGQETENEKVEITPVHEDTENNKPASEVGNKNEAESEGKIPGFEVSLAVLGIVLGCRAKRRRGG